MQLTICALLAGSVAANEGYRVFEKLSSPPAPWVVTGDAPAIDPELRFKLRIHLQNRNVEEFQHQALLVSTPDHPAYGRHFTRDEVNALLAPPAAAFARVLEWLGSYNLTTAATVENDWVVVATTIGAVETLLDAKYAVFENPESGQKAARTLAYSLPADLHRYVDLVAPTIKFTSLAPQRSTIVQDFPAPATPPRPGMAADIHDGLDTVACNTTITPACLRALYKFSHFRGSRRHGNQIALAGFLEEYAQHDDLAQFLRTYVGAGNGSQADFDAVLINGGRNTQDATGGPQSIVEANLDVQYGVGLAYPTPSLYFSTGGRPPETVGYELDNEPYLEFLTYLLAQDALPQTISISYGDSEWGVPVSYARTACDLFAQVSARGVSVLVLPPPQRRPAPLHALLNGDRLAHGLPPFGFLNPWLYTKGVSSLVDITRGKGDGCAQIPGSGFAATKGWDPVTGLGTPDFKKLRAASLASPRMPKLPA
ncbi:unnamed protein product [Diplocarpon coronariae]